MAATLTARSLSKHFGSRVAVSDVGFTVAPGEIVGIVGPNGAGKTTLLSILAGALAPDAGELSVAGGRAGWVPQSPALYGRLSVAENLRLFARLERVPDVPGVVDATLDRIGLADRAGEPVARLSGGNRQRVNIGIGLVAAPPVLLLDEPTAALDPRGRDELWRFVAGLAAEGTSVVFSTHDLAEVERFACRVLLLADGTLLFAGTPAALAAAAERTGTGDLEAALLTYLRARGH